LLSLITIKHRSLSGVEREISEVEYLSAPFSTTLAPVLLRLKFCDVDIRAIGKKYLVLAHLSHQVI